MKWGVPCEITTSSQIKPLLGSFHWHSPKLFFLCRQILDVMITTHEVIHSTDKRNKHGMALRLDISKAYDKVYWSVLYEVLDIIRFSGKIVGCLEAW